MNPVALTHNEISVNVRQLCSYYHLDADLLLRNTIMDLCKEEGLRHMVLGMNRRIASGDTVEVTDTLKIPADWWQHLKERWFPAWALKCWPVGKRDIIVASQITRMCPHVDLATQHSSHFRWLLAQTHPTSSIRVEQSP